ncbi:MAG: preprotein translocase subunit SecG [Thalassovita sp.]
MENVVLIIHLLLALSLIGIVLLQRSEGGGLGMGGGGGGVASRSSATALSKVTWVLAAGFICTSLALTVIATEKTAGSSVLDRLGGAAATEEAQPEETQPGNDLLPPSAGDTGPLVPRAD